MELKRKHSEIIHSQKNENHDIARLSKSKDVAEKRENIIGHKTDKISELRGTLEWKHNEVKELKEETEELKKMKALGPVVKIGKQSGLCNIKFKGLYGWLVNVIQALLEMLSHCTPLACISANMLTIAEIFFLEGADKVDEHHSDATKQHGISIHNSTLLIQNPEGVRKRVCLDLGIIAKNKTAQGTLHSIMCTFQQGRDLLWSWRDVTAHEYPDANELLELIPKPEALCISRLANGAYLMTDTCITEQLFKAKFVKTIQQIAKKKGTNEDDIK
eukprot:1744959-Ditylum_brightwellii.AAC.1